MGRTDSRDFPIAGAPRGELAGVSDAFVVRLERDGSGLDFASLLGGDGADAAHAVALTADGDAWLAGRTDNTDFPTAHDRAAESASSKEFASRPGSAGHSGSFLARLSGDALTVSSTRRLDGLEVEAIALDPQGAPFLTGRADGDAFVARIDPLDGSPVYTVRFGGSSDDAGLDIAVDDSSSIYVAGRTRSADFPASPPALQPAPGGAEDGFLAVLAAEDGSLLYSGYAGGPGDDRLEAVFVGADGSPWIVGSTDSARLVLIEGAGIDVAPDERPTGAGPTGVVARLDVRGLPARSRYLRGEAGVRAEGAASDRRGQVAVTGRAGRIAGELRLVEPAPTGGDAFVALLPFAGAQAQAAGCPGTINFDDDSGDGLWQTASNWDTDTLPVATDDVCIGAFDVTFSSIVQTVQSLAVDAAGSLTLTSGTLTLGGDSFVDGTLVHGGGTLNGAGDLIVAGNYEWTGGTLGGGGGALLAQGGLQITGGSKFLSRTIVNSGTTVYESTGNGLYLGTGAVIDNLPGAVFDVRNETAFTFNGGSPSFVNQGTFVKSAGSGTFAFHPAIAFANDGVLDVQSGAVSLTRSATHTGTFDCTGAVLRFDGGTHTLDPTTIVTGTEVVFGGAAVTVAGSYQVVGTTLTAGTLNLSTAGGHVTLATLLQSGGTLTGSSDVDVAGAATWSAGAQSGTGETRFLGGLALAGSGSTSLARTMRNAGSAVLSGTGNFGLSTNAVVHNLAGATFEIQTDADLPRLGGAPEFHNAGTFRKSGGVATSAFGAFISFTNSGAVEALAGTLSIPEFVQTAGSTTVNGGILSSGGVLDVQGGLLTGVGDVLAPSVDSAGVVAPGLSASTGILSVSGSYTQQSTGSFRVELAGIGCTDGDRLDVGGSVSLDGALDVVLVGGCQPSPGQSFTLIAAGSVGGSFASFVPPATDCPVDWSVTYNPDSVVLEVLTGVCDDDDGDGASVCCGTCAPALGDVCNDCDDADPASYPGAPELCDGSDNDCDTSLPAVETDDDGDLHVECVGWNDTQGNAPQILGGGDCDDADSASFPGAAEVCDGNDNDCDPVIPPRETDGDGDHHVTCSGWDDTQGDQGAILGGSDCDDADPASYPGAPELCDGSDNDCDTSLPAVETDDDGDLHVECVGWNDTQGNAPQILGGGDCDDADNASFPGAAEVCDGNDNDCDTVIPPGETDGDLDLYVQCSGWDDSQGDQPQILGGGDCEPADSLIHPGAAEVCDAVDNDCSGLADDADGDEDGFPVCADCDDTNGAVHAVPSPTRDLAFASPTLLLWTAPTEPGGAAVVYDTIRAGGPTDFAGAAVCVETDDGSDTQSAATGEPGPGGIYFYLTRAENGCGSGSVGADSGGVERAAIACP